MSDYGIKIAKSGIDVKTATLKQLKYTSELDTTKVLMSGTLSISLPSETFGNDPMDSVRIHTTSVEHNMGDIVQYTPIFGWNVVYVYGDIVSGASYNINDLAEEDMPIYGVDFLVSELAFLRIDETNFYMDIVRFSGGMGDVTFGARTASVDYTLYYNRVDEEIDLLN